MPKGFEVGAPPGAAGPTDAPARTTAAKRAAAEAKAEEAKQAALTGEVLPPEGEAQPEDPTVAIRGALLLSFTLGFDVVARLKGEHWRLVEPEVTALVDGWTPVVALYAPAVVELGPWAGALVASAAVLGPRVLAELDKEKKAEKAKQTEQAAPAPAPA